MGLFDWLFGAPTLKQVAKEVETWLRQQHAEDICLKLDMAEITATLKGRPCTIYLGNLLADYRNSPRAGRAALLERFLSGVTGDNMVPVRWEDAKPLLMPVVRGRMDLGLGELSARRTPVAEKPFSGTPHRPLAADLMSDLVVALVCDMPTSMAYVTEEHLQQWHLGFDEAMEHALQNLRGLPEAQGWRELSPGVWLGEWGDSYDSSRLLLPDLIHRLGVPEPVLLAPFRNALMVCSARQPAALLEIAQRVTAAMDDNPRWLSFEPLRLEGSQWRAHTPPPEVAEALRVLQQRNLGGAYGSQKKLLDHIHQAAQQDVFVANFQLVRRDAAPERSFAVWSEGVDTLLPTAELIAFVLPRDGQHEHWLVSWADVQAIAGALLEPVDLQPRRHRVRRFPDAAMLDQLRERAVEL
ncbi:hypothetical protein RQP53_17540 [Paucibacter sp. APW11]|uniref:DUF1444 domain-containing protein n=1 Tax=Roseateles aquae TaxID=3077235 RepID=A0ABU3PEP6_9BURK|nr:hypothetical protein [Paucibacter sp. APW11]MDT9001086.1 hypothetical protein [Paucibacter sp. APW11]